MSPKCWIYAAEARTLSDFEARAARMAQAVLVVNERERDLIAGLEPSAPDVACPARRRSAIDVEAAGPPIHRPGLVVFCGVMNYRLNEEGRYGSLGQCGHWFGPAVRHARLSLVGSDPTAAVRALPRRRFDHRGDRDRTGRAPVFVASGGGCRAAPHRARRSEQSARGHRPAGLPSVVTPAVFEGLPPEIRQACRAVDDAKTFAAAIVEILSRPRRANATPSSPGRMSRVSDVGHPARPAAGNSRGRLANLRMIPHFCHVFSSFDPGGAEVRTVALINNLGSAARHTIIATNGRYGAAERIHAHISHTIVPPPAGKGSLLYSLSIARTLQEIGPTCCSPTTGGPSMP